MDLRHYYAAVREIEEQIAEQDVLVVSEATTDGGRSGAICEVTRSAGARLVVEKKARLATAEEEAAFRRLRPVETATQASEPIPLTVAAITAPKQSATPRTRKG